MPVPFDKLYPFMYTGEKEPISSIVEIKPISLPETPASESSLLETKCLKAVQVQDGLFWSIFIAHYGYDEYLRNKYNYGKIEIQEKQKIAAFISSEMTRLKTNYKLTRVFCNEIISDLTTLPKMEYSGLIGMSAYYKSDIIIVDTLKNIYYSFICLEEDKKTIILYKNPGYTKKYNSNEFFIDIDHAIQSFDHIREKYFGLEHYEKPLKGISTYLKPELEKIALKTIYKNEELVSSPKQELYNQILMYFQ
jgi:hypothetical protein